MVAGNSGGLGIAADPVQLRAFISLLMADDVARQQAVPLNHPPEQLNRSPAKIEILVNSLVVFMERGVSEVTVQDLLDSAGISRRTFYKYFRNKIDVLESLYKLAIDVMVIRYKSQIGGATSAEQVAIGMVDVFFAYHRDLGPVIRMMQEEAVRSDSPLAPHRVRGMLTVVDIVNEEVFRIHGSRLDPLLIQALLWAMENTSINLLRGGVPPAQELEHGRDVMAMIASAAFAKGLAARLAGQCVGS